jgi:hypothetical protein
MVVVLVEPTATVEVLIDDKQPLDTSDTSGCAVGSTGMEKRDELENKGSDQSAKITKTLVPCSTSSSWL